MRVKICGITSTADAQLAEAAGADAIGLILAEGSRRQLDVAAATEIARSVGPFVTTVGVFRNQPLEFVLRAAAQLRLNAVQLHGAENREYVDSVRSHCRVIKALPFTSGMTPAELESWPADGLLVDAVTPGGGKAFDWNAATAIAGWPRLILAGGLNPENVAEAIRVLRPAAVDLASGVEAAPGIKSVELVRGFMRAVRAAQAVSTTRSVY